jgi:hypothetical protein
MTLAPQATTKIHLTGHIATQSGDNLTNIGTLFTGFLQGKNQTLLVKGDTVDPGNGVVSWLSTAFKTIELQIVLPGQKFDVRGYIVSMQRSHTDRLRRSSKASLSATSEL